MRIAIQAADLDARRIDGTRVYILNLLKYFGKIDQKSRFLIYHKKKFNPELIPPDFSNYEIKPRKFPFLWTQTRFAWELWRERPDVLWMPMHNIPLLKNPNLKTVVTIHDLAFKCFPEAFTKKDLRNLNLLADWAIKKSNKIIAVSQSTKSDILKFYPEIKAEKIQVIYHGFDAELFSGNFNDCETEKCLLKYGIFDKAQGAKLKAKNCNAKLKTKYLLYTGAIQPRKNLIRLIEAFEILKKAELSEFNPDGGLKLVLAGSPAWMAEEILERAKKSSFRKDIILTGRVPFFDLAKLYAGATVFIFPSLYEGFGIPVLEAFASGVPVVCAKNSSLPEVGGEACLYFDAKNSDNLAERIRGILENEGLKNDLVKKGKKQLEKFSWEKCAQETLEYLKN